MVKKLLISFLFLNFLLVIICINKCYATVPITDENLKNVFNEFISSSSNDNNYRISLESEIIKIESDDGTYILNYNLKNKPTFWYEVEINEGMSYDEFKKKTGFTSELDCFGATRLGYYAIAKIQGVAFEDSIEYLGLKSLDYHLSQSYTILKDEFEKKSGLSIKQIHESAFGNYVMDYTYDLSLIRFRDNEDSDIDFNTFEWKIQRKDVTATSCKLVLTMTINQEADFSKMNGILETGLSYPDSESGDYAEIINNETENNITYEYKDNSISEKSFSNTRIIMIIIFTMIVLAISLVVIFKDKKK